MGFHSFSEIYAISLDLKIAGEFLLRALFPLIVARSLADAVYT